MRTIPLLNHPPLTGEPTANWMTMDLTLPQTGRTTFILRSTDELESSISTARYSTEWVGEWRTIARSIWNVCGAASAQCECILQEAVWADAEHLGVAVRPAKYGSGTCTTAALLMQRAPNGGSTGLVHRRARLCIRCTWCERARRSGLLQRTFSRQRICVG